MTANGVRFLEEPRREAYGAVAVFEDLYGNRWDLIEPVRVCRSSSVGGLSGDLRSRSSRRP